MWKRLQQNKPGRQQAPGDASLSEALPAEDAYRNPQSGLLDGEQLPKDGASHPARPPRPPGQPLKGLPPLPFQPVQPPRETRTRPPSSIYSQPSPRPQITGLPRINTEARAYGEQVEISPPSSPDTHAAGSKQFRSTQGVTVSPEISPVDEVRGVSKIQLRQPTSRPGSGIGGTNIPVLRREKRRNQVAAAAANIISHNDGNNGDGAKTKKIVDTRWDTLTGEPTTSERGRLPQVKPSEFTPPSNSIYDTAVDRGMGLLTTGTAAPKNQNSFGERVRKLKESNIMTGARPEWKGSSGRATIVPPVADQLDTPPLSIPRKSSKRAASPRYAGSGASTPVSVVPSGQSDTPIVSPATSGYAGPTIRPIVPSQVGKNSSVSSGTALQSHPHSALIDSQSSAQNTTTFVSSQNRGSPLPTSAGEHTNQHNRTDSTTSIERNFREALKDINFPTSSRPQEVSRFSVTTYATSTAASTPQVGAESPPPMPTPPRQPTPPQHPTPIVDRSRPRVGSVSESSKATTRKAVPGSPVFISMSSSSASRRNSKLLPKSPPEVQSVDLITSLQAQLDNLANRRTNLQKSIHQMTELMPADTLARGMEARRQAEEKKKVEMLREDLADVQREEHELGLRLHRAWKRMDENAVYEPTGLWVRRVTG